MYKGKHCSYQDYLNIQKKCDAFIHALNKNESTFLLEGEKLYVEILDYDREIASRFIHVLKSSDEKEKNAASLKKILDELLRNVLVDVNEHK